MSTRLTRPSVTAVRARRRRTGLVAVAAATLAIGVGAAPAHAAAGSWTQSQPHGTIYAESDYSTSFYARPQTTLPAGAVITGTSVTVRPYANGFLTDSVTICYQRQFDLTPLRCLD